METRKDIVGLLNESIKEFISVVNMKQKGIIEKLFDQVSRFKFITKKMRSLQANNELQIQSDKLTCELVELILAASTIGHHDWNIVFDNEFCTAIKSLYLLCPPTNSDLLINILKEHKSQFPKSLTQLNRLIIEDKYNQTKNDSHHITNIPWP